ncbi:MAG: efflux RND transporter periplasmic adaptor subunit [Burkholderiales bacterium]|nr:efflux RND transporter periplasmic adaptor subunit [Burkholderiales bacterium]
MRRHITCGALILRRTRASRSAIATMIVAAMTFVASPTAAAQAAPKEAPATAAKPAMTVTVARPTQANWPIRLVANGNIAAWQEAVIGAEVNGLKLNDVRVNVGDVVARGQTLATFAPESIRAEVAQQTAGVVEAEAALAEAQANLERSRRLRESGMVSLQQLTQSETAARTAAARLDAAKAARESGQLRLGFTRVAAPDDGVISARSATIGGVVNAGQELFRMIRKNRLEWRAEVTSTELARVSPGQAVSVSLPSGATIVGKVRVVAPTVDPASRNAIVYVDLAANPAARAGMYVRGEFAVGAAAALSLPQQAVVLRDGFSYVFVVDSASRVSQVKVQAGRREGDRVEIASGLKGTESVVASGAAFLADGDTVRVVSAGAPASAPKQGG